MKDKKKITFSIFGIIVLAIVFLGATYSFYETTSDEALRDVRVQAHTLDTLTFSISNNLTLVTNQDNFADGEGNVTGEATATARLTPNSKTGSATGSYNAAFYISKNETVYSTANTNHDPEYIIQVYDPSNNLVTLTGLGAQKTIKGVTGYDITGYTGLVTIVTNKAISASNYTATVENWRVVITAINLDIKQNDNAGTKISGKLLVSKDSIDYCKVNPTDCLNLAVSNMPQTAGKNGTASCTGATTSWNNKYNQLEISGVSTNNLNCTLSYSNPTGTTPLNTYLTNISGTTQGNGTFINDTYDYDYVNQTNVTTFKYGVPDTAYTNSPVSSGETPMGINQAPYWIFNSTTGQLTSQPQYMTNYYSYYNAYFTPPEDGFYQVCYEIAQSSNTNNSLNIHVYARSSSSYILGVQINSSTSNSVSGCYDLGFLETDNNNIVLSERGYSNTSSPVIQAVLRTASYGSFSTGYRYEGKNPNNYVMFNNELWRIIGVFDTEYDTNNDGTPNATGNLVKIIREEPIGGLAWDKTGTNDWPNSSLYHLLNEQYYDWDTNKNNVNTYCYAYSYTTPAVCDYSVKGIQDEYRSMIAKTKWYLGGAKLYLGNGNTIGYTTYYLSNIYSYERTADAVTAGNSSSTLGYIGLMYESDYLFGSLASNCIRTTYHDSYNTAGCAGNNWLYGKGNEWTITPNSAPGSYTWYIASNGGIMSISPSNGMTIRPVLYLLPSVYKISGTGTATDPYIIGM